MLFSFRIRSPLRDETTDEMRFDDVLRSIRRAIGDVEKETAGLRARAEAARCSAAFAMEALDQDENDTAMDERIRSLTSILLQCEERLEQLERQSRFLNQLETDVLDFRSDAHPPYQPALSSRTASSLPNR